MPIFSNIILLAWQGIFSYEIFVIAVTHIYLFWKALISPLWKWIEVWKIFWWCPMLHQSSHKNFITFWDIHFLGHIFLITIVTLEYYIRNTSLLWHVPPKNIIPLCNDTFSRGQIPFYDDKHYLRYLIDVTNSDWSRVNLNSTFISTKRFIKGFLMILKSILGNFNQYCLNFRNIDLKI